MAKTPQKVLTQPMAPKIGKAQTLTPASKVTSPAKKAGRPKLPTPVLVRQAKKGK